MVRGSIIMGAQLRNPLKPPVYHSTMVPRGLREALNRAPIIPRGVSFSDDKKKSSKHFAAKVRGFSSESFIYLFPRLEIFITPSGIMWDQLRATFTPSVSYWSDVGGFHWGDLFSTHDAERRFPLGRWHA